MHTYSWGNRETEKLYNLVKIAQALRERIWIWIQATWLRTQAFPAGIMELPVSHHQQKERACFYVGALMCKSFPSFSPCPAFLNRCLLNLILYTSILLNYFPLRSLAHFTKRKNEKQKQKQELSNPHKIHWGMHMLRKRNILKWVLS